MGNEELITKILKQACKEAHMRPAKIQVDEKFRLYEHAESRAKGLHFNMPFLYWDNPDAPGAIFADDKVIIKTNLTRWETFKQSIINALKDKPNGIFLHEQPWGQGDGHISICFHSLKP